METTRDRLNRLIDDYYSEDVCVSIDAEEQIISICKEIMIKMNNIYSCLELFNMPFDVNIVNICFLGNDCITFETEENYYTRFEYSYLDIDMDEYFERCKRLKLEELKNTVDRLTQQIEKLNDKRKEIMRLSNGKETV